MPRKKKPLPKPPSTPFGRKRAFEDSDDRDSLMADQMAMAMSEGKLDEFMERELPDSEHARKLAEMMMGMSGMMPAAGMSEGSTQRKESPPEKTGQKKDEHKPDPEQPPEAVFDAVKSADVKGLMDILKKEHCKRQGISEDEAEEAMRKTSPDQAVIEKEILEDMIRIASDNNLSLDWIFFRALKRYVQEYQKTGNL